MEITLTSPINFLSEEQQFNHVLKKIEEALKGLTLCDNGRALVVEIPREIQNYFEDCNEVVFTSTYRKVSEAYMKAGWAGVQIVESSKIATNNTEQKTAKNKYKLILTMPQELQL